MEGEQTSRLDRDKEDGEDSDRAGGLCEVEDKLEVHRRDQIGRKRPERVCACAAILSHSSQRKNV